MDSRVLETHLRALDISDLPLDLDALEHSCNLGRDKIPKALPLASDASKVLEVDPKAPKPRRCIQGRLMVWGQILTLLCLSSCLCFPHCIVLCIDVIFFLVKISIINKHAFFFIVLLCTLIYSLLFPFLFHCRLDKFDGGISRA